jgi:DNA-binding transcriptional LysR family regulator
METRQLRYFVAVAEERHFGRAALRLHMAQPPLSQQIKQLEDQLQTRLLVRTTRKVELTPAGELLLDRARALLAELDQLAQDVRLVGQGASGVIRIGVAGSTTYRLMPRIVEAVRSRMPELKLNVHGEMLTPQMERALEENRIDVALLRPPIRSEELELKFLGQDELVLALPENHPLAAGGELHLSDLTGQPFVCYPPGSAVSGIFLDAARRAGFRPDIVQEARETSTLLSFVASGMGIALVPMSRSTFGLQGIVFRSLVDAPGVDLALAWRKGDARPLISNFISIFDTLAPPDLEGTAP